MFLLLVSTWLYSSIPVCQAPFFILFSLTGYLLVCLLLLALQGSDRDAQVSVTERCIRDFDYINDIDDSIQWNLPRHFASRMADMLDRQHL